VTGFFGVYYVSGAHRGEYKRIAVARKERAISLYSEPTVWSEAMVTKTLSSGSRFLESKEDS
jgi:hypothetical protein